MALKNKISIGLGIVTLPTVAIMVANCPAGPGGRLSLYLIAARIDSVLKRVCVSGVSHRQRTLFWLTLLVLEI